MATTATTDRTEQLMEALTRRVEDLRTSESWMAWLAHAARFHNYSANNVLLIGLQDPEATQVAGFRKWQEMGRQVRKGEKALFILAPNTRVRKETDEATGEETKRRVVTGFRGAAVFDVRQTDGEELPESPASRWARAIAEIAATDPSEADHARFVTLETAAATLGLTVILEPEAAPGAAQGWWPKGSRTVHVCEGDPRSMASTLAHEMSHALDPDLPTSSYEASELVAESSAHIVSALLGLETAPVTDTYLAGWKGDGESLRAVAARTLKVAHEIIDALGIEFEGTDPEDGQ